jgi:hypothetical protein
MSNTTTNGEKPQDGRCTRCGWLHLTPDCPIIRHHTPTNEHPSADLDFDEVERWLAEEARKRGPRYALALRVVVRQPYPLPDGFPS